jgi:hypothetical protein
MPDRLPFVQDGQRCRGSRADAGQSGERAAEGDGIDRRAGCAAENCGRRTRFRLGASPPRAPPGAEIAFTSSGAACHRATAMPAVSRPVGPGVARCRGSRAHGAPAGQSRDDEAGVRDGIDGRLRRRERV